MTGELCVAIISLVGGLAPFSTGNGNYLTVHYMSILNLGMFDCPSI